MISASSFWLFLALCLAGSLAQDVVTAEVGYGNDFNPGCRDKSCFQDSDVRYHAEYTCSNDTLYWQEGIRTFTDPIPDGNMIVSVSITLHLTFGCANYYSDPTGTVVTLQGSVFRFIPPINATQSCDCLNCMRSVAMDALNIYTDGWPNYNYGGVNQLRIVPSQFMCVSRAVLSFTYDERGKPTMTNFFPSLIPVGTTSIVTVRGKDFVASSELYCSFGGELTDATFVDDTSIKCPAVEASDPGQVVFQILDQDNPISNNTGTFKWYNSPVIESFYPPSGSSAGVNITLVGRNFFQSSTMMCRFAGLPVWEVEVVSDTMVICMNVEDYVYETPRNVSVAFSENSVDFVSARDEFAFLGDITMSPTPSVTPSLSVSMTLLPSGVVRPSPSVSPSASMTPSVSMSFEMTATPTPSTSLPVAGPTPKEEDGIPDFIWAAFGVAIIIFVVLLLGIAILLIQRRRGASAFNQSNFFPDSSPSGGGGVQDPNAIPLKEIKDLVQIEKGSFGVIYEAKWRGTKIAVKKLPSAMNDKLMKEFYQEAALMRALRHPNILQYLGVAQSGSDVCICMEFMSNGSLYRLLHRPDSSYSRRRIKAICMDTVRGMNYLHQQSPPIVHRDLKSHNLLVDSHWTVKVCDFGLSRITEHNQTMTACGTPSWTAPEVLRNERYTTKADVYGFGVVVWEMFARADPFPGMPPFQIVFAVGTQKLRPRIEPDWPLEWVNLMTSCWSEDPAARPTFENLITIIEGLDNPI